MMQPLMYRDTWEDVPSAPYFVHLAYQCSFLFVCFVGMYAGHLFHLITGFYTLAVKFGCEPLQP